MKKLLRIGVFFFSYLLVFGLGMYSYKNESIREKISSLVKTKNFSYSNYKAGRNADIPTIYLDIPDSAFNVIKAGRSNAIEDGILRDSNKIEVDAVMRSEQDTFNIEMRLKGDYGDHWRGDKWSYRIKVRQGKRFGGMKSFSIQDPATRGFMNEWYYHKLLAHEGLIALRYRFVRLVENGVDKGVYAVEQSFDKRLIEGNLRREAPILKFDESILIDKSKINAYNTYSQEDLYLMAKVDMFKSNKTLKDSVLYDQYQKGKRLLVGLRSGEFKASEVIDIPKAAMLFAIADLVGSHHSLRWKNVRFYYNPVVGKLELIGFDSNSGRPMRDIYYNLWKNKDLGVFACYLWKDVFFTDEAFVAAYFESLKKISSDNYLKSFHKSIQGEMNLYLSYLYSENSFYNFHHEYYQQNADSIAVRINEHEKSLKPETHEYFVEVKAAEPIHLGDTVIEVQIVNKSMEAIKVDGIFDPFERKISREAELFVPGRSTWEPAVPYVFTFHLKTPIDSMNMVRKINKNRWVHKKIKLGYRYENQTGDTCYTKIEEYYNLITIGDKNRIVDEALKVDDEHQNVTINQGEWTFTKDVVIPEGYSFTVPAGTSIILNNGATLSINGKAEFLGTAENNIAVSSDDSSGTVLVYQAGETSKIMHTNFSGLAEKHFGPWHLSGAVNFYESNVSLDHVKFENNKSEDALNIIRSKFTLNNAHFYQIYADAFDGDFCDGKVLNTTFDIIGNDALDFSGSLITVKNVQISNVGDKALSAGEKSNMIAVNVNVSNAELAFVSKDFSYLKLTDVNINNTKVGFTVFTKKKDYGPARLEVVNYTSEGITEKYLVESGSVVYVDDKRIKPNHQDVSSILYGAQYGKSSH